MAWLMLGLILFLGVHSIRMVAPQWREARIEAVGEGPWKGAYSLVAIIGLAIIVWGYSIAWQDFVLVYFPPAWGVPVALVLMIFAFISLMVSQLPAGVLKPTLKHPMLLSVKIWALAHLLVNGDLASVLLFGTFLVWAIINRIAVKRRGGPVSERGPVINDIIAIASGLAIWALFVWWLHEWLFGVSPLVH